MLHHLLFTAALLFTASNSLDVELDAAGAQQPPGGDASASASASAPASTPSAAADVYRARLTAVYAKYAASKLATVDAVLLKYKGREARLFQLLKEKYGPEPGQETKAKKAKDSTDGHPALVPRVLSWWPRIVEYDGFFTDDECDTMVRTSQEHPKFDKAKGFNSITYHPRGA